MSNPNFSAFISPIMPPSNIPGSGRISRNDRNVGDNSLINPSPSGSPNPSGGGGGIGRIVRAGKAVWGTIPDQYKEQGYEYIKGKGKEILSGNKTMSTSGYALSKAPNPQPIRLDSGIIPNTYTSDYLDAKEVTCSPLHLTTALIQIPTDAADKLYTYFKDIIIFDIQSKAQANVSFNLDIASNFSATKILTAMNNLLEALQVYLFYKSIISYHSDPRNKNEGMVVLRRSIDSSMIETLTALERRLSDIPIPPRLLELVRYLSANYFSGNNQGSPMVKIVPHELNDALIVNGTKITSVLNALATNDNNNIYSILRRAIPQWNPRVIYDVDPSPYFDENFLTIWANLPFNTYDTAIGNWPTVANSTSVIAYNSFTNELDGVAFALTSAYDASTSRWSPGLLTPPGTTMSVPMTNSRRSFYEKGGAKTFWIVKDDSFLTRARPETYYSPTPATISSGHLYGTDRCLNVTADTVRETAMKSLDFLLDLDSIVNLRRSGFNESAVNTNIKSDKKGRRRPKSKTK